MKRIVVLLAGILSFVILQADSKMMFEKTSLDFGTIDSGKNVDVVFKFENKGNETLIIKNVRSTCGCAVPRLKKTKYEPGEKGEIPVRFHSKNYNGKVLKRISISTNSKETPFISLIIRGTVTMKDFAKIEIIPDVLNFKDLKLGSVYKAKVKIKNEGTVDLNILELTHSCEINIKTQNNVVPPKGETEIEVEVKPFKKGFFSSFIKIKTNAFRQYFTLLKVSGQII